MNPVRIKSIDISSSWANDEGPPCIGSMTVNVGAHPVRLTLNQDQIDRIVEAALTPAMETLREVGKAMTPQAIRMAVETAGTRERGVGNGSPSNHGD